MRKSMFLAIVLSLCMVQSGAFAATRGGNPSVAPARSAVRSAVRSATVTPVMQKDTPKVANTSTTSRTRSSDGTSNGSGPNKVKAARAGTTQKVIQTGSKIATAQANTAVPQECQDAFFGCMDSFCMIDNASGGRCQCSDRNEELLKVMDDIAKLDEQSYAMATEGVERIQMGQDAEQIIANAKAAGDKVTGKALDLSAWNNNVFSEDDNIFDDIDVSVDSSVVSNALNKSGVALYNSAAKMCVSQMPAQCANSLNMLQSVYAQKIKSDCIAFENSLKQQKIASTQKLQTAEKALRDAALEKFREENKYSTTGECVQAYAQCMESECGNDYSKCIQFAAEENIKGSKANEKSRTIKGVVDIILSGATMTQITSKKSVCDGQVLKYCVNHQNEVWGKYLEYAATALKSAEVNSEDNLRQNCIKDLATCYQGACAAKFDPNQEEASYDMCLSDPELVVDFCKVKLDACIVATGGSGATSEGVKGSKLWKGVTAMLGALRVDACTKEVKSGIAAICGEDFSHCVGLNPGTIAELLPTDTLTACMKKNNNDRDEILQYISEVAQGYTLQMNDKMYEVCEDAAKNAMIKVCGNADTCDTLNLGNVSFDSLLTVQLCKDKDCKASVNDFKDEEIVKGQVTPHIRNRININSIVFEPSDDENERGNFTYKITGDDNYYADFADPNSPEVKNVLNGLTNLFKNKMSVMAKDKTVNDCMNGKKVTGFKTSSATTDSKGTKVVSRRQNTINNADSEEIDYAYTNLLDSYQEVLISKTLELLKQKYDQAEKDLQPQIDALNNEITQRLSNIEGAKAEDVHQMNENNCALLAMDANMLENGNPCDCDDDLVDYNLPFPNAGSKLNKNSKHAASGRCEGLKYDVKGEKLQICDCFKNRDGYCMPGGRWFFKTGEGRNYNGKLLKYTTYSYDRTNSTCTLTTTDYKCTYYLSPYCWSWDETGVQSGSPQVVKMPQYNREEHLLKTMPVESSTNEN